MMSTRLGWVIGAVAAATLHTASACTIFTIVDGETVLMGNSEDFTKPGAIWFVPAAEGRFARVNVGFHNVLDRREDFAQGSMNEKGLAFDAAVTGKVPWQADPKKQSPDNLLEKIMNECATVEEAIAYFKQYNCKHLSGSQFMLADATGASAVITWQDHQGLSVVHRSGNVQVATNVRLEPTTYRCQRWVRATRELKSPAGTPWERARRALSGIHQRGPAAFTSYSCIYDLQKRSVYIFVLADFEQPVELNLAEELADGPTEYLMKDLLKDPPSLRSIKSKPQRTDYSTRIALNPDQLQRLAGTYSPDVAPDVQVRIKATADGLEVHNPGQPVAELFPESPTSFRLIPDRGQVSFHLNEDGSVEGLTLHKQRDVHATRRE